MTSVHAAGSVSIVSDDASGSGPFEGPEKLLELWFAPSPAHLAAGSRAGSRGLRAVESEVWNEVLDQVRCKVLSVIRGEQVDAYLLS
jgi:S-adenosylmethionine decarboxylase